MEKKEKYHFVLVHGASHGAWCWRKLLPLLTSNGHKATAIDLAASGDDPTNLSEVRSVHDYIRPLMDCVSSLPPHEKVVLVAHSLGGIGVSAAMEAFPMSILAAIFVTAVMPGRHSPLADVLVEFWKRNPMESFMDTKFDMTGGGGGGGGGGAMATSVTIGPAFMSSKMYQCSSSEDLHLAETLVRPASIYMEDLQRGEVAVTSERFGSVPKAFVVCKEDELIKEELQRWMIERSEIGLIVKEIEGADHMVMFSRPRQLFQSISEIAQEFSGFSH